MLQPYVRIHGREEVIRALKKLPDKVTRLGLKRAMLDFGVVIKQRYMQNIPDDIGIAKRSIRHWIRMNGANGVILKVGPVNGQMNRQNKTAADYLHFPDHGTKNIRAQRFAGKSFREALSALIGIIATRVKQALRTP